MIGISTLAFMLIAQGLGMDNAPSINSIAWSSIDLSVLEQCIRFGVLTRSWRDTPDARLRLPAESSHTAADN